MTTKSHIKGLLDERAFNETFEANLPYKNDLDHHWLYAFVCHYESAKAAKPVKRKPKDRP